MVHTTTIRSAHFRHLPAKNPLRERMHATSITIATTAILCTTSITAWTSPPNGLIISVLSLYIHGFTIPLKTSKNGKGLLLAAGCQYRWPGRFHQVFWLQRQGRRQIRSEAQT